MKIKKLKKVSANKFKRILLEFLVTMKPGELHEFFPVSVFNNLPSQYKLSDKINYEENKPIICYAGDIARNTFEYYKVLSVDLQKNIVESYYIDPESPGRGYRCTFYLDSVAIIPKEVLMNKEHVLDENKLLEEERKKKRIKREQKEKHQDKIEELSK